ncbi:hypothetical protein Misp06_00709 [Microbulbifer sp. NBRC 101763]
MDVLQQHSSRNQNATRHQGNIDPVTSYNQLFRKEKELANESTLLLGKTQYDIT